MARVQYDLRVTALGGLGTTKKALGIDEKAQYNNMLKYLYISIIQWSSDFRFLYHVKS